jgi:hypothetical protein
LIFESQSVKLLKEAIAQDRAFILNRLDVTKNPRCANVSIGGKASLDAVANLQEVAAELGVLADAWLKQNPESELPKKLRDLQIWFGALLPMALDLFLLFAMVAFMLRLVALMLGGSVWAASLLLPGKKSLGSAPILKEALQLAVYLPAVTAGYFLVQALLNVILPKTIYLTLGHLRFSNDLDLDSLKNALFGFTFVSAIISLMILQLIFTIPQLIAKLIGYSETDFGVNSATNKVETQTINKMSLPSQPSLQNAGNLDKSFPKEAELQKSTLNKKDQQL